MKLLLLTLLSFSYSTEIMAQFDGTNITVSKPQKNSIKVLKFVYRNKDKTPNILVFSNYASSSSPCHLSKPSEKPILPGKSLEIFANCKFLTTGYFNRNLADVQISTSSRKYNVSLSFNASVEENLSNRIVDNKNHTTCTEIDLNKEKILPKIPILDQDGVGSCYAHAAASLYEYELKKSNKNQTISPIDIGLIYKLNEDDNQNSINSGVVITALKNINQTGAATRECIDRVIREEAKKSNLTTEHYINLIQKIYKELANLKKSMKPSKDLQDTCNAYKISEDELSRLTKMLDGTLIEYLNEEFAQCGSDRALVKGAFTGKAIQQINGSKEKRKSVLDDLLKNKSLPTISMCAQIIQGQPDHVGVKDDGKPLTKDKCGYHAVLVSARKNMGGQCHYLVRNSWGADWKRKELTCACQTTSGYFQDCSKAPASASNKKYVGCWVKESSLWNNTYEVSGIK